MASKDQIRKHLAMSSGIKLANPVPLKSEEIRKARIMEHLQKSQGLSS